MYYQLEEQIKKQIESGELQPGDMLPSEREYAELINVSRMTVRQAMNNLVDGGYLYRQKGRGTFVAEKKVEQELGSLTSFTEDMKARGLVPSSKLLSFEIIPAPEKIANQLQIKNMHLFMKSNGFALPTRYQWHWKPCIFQQISLKDSQRKR
ncbi:GntR family transcriptional regulator [Ectobacillus funiculus]